MHLHLLSAIEADINKTSVAQQQNPQDVNLATKKQQLAELAMEYVQLENRYREISGLNSVY